MTATKPNYTEPTETTQAAPVTILVFPRGQISEYDKARMNEVGVLAVEADDPKSVVEIEPTVRLKTARISGDAMLRAALSAIANQPPETSSNSITSAGRAACEFVRALAASMEPPQGSAQ